MIYRYFSPALDLGGSGLKQHLYKTIYFIPTTFNQNPSSGSGEEFENVKSLQTDRRMDGKRTARYDNSLLEPSVQVS